MKTSTLLGTTAAALVLATLTPPTRDARADQYFVSFTGQTQGAFGVFENPTPTLGGVDLLGFLPVEDLAWKLVSPRDPASGLPTGKRIHSAFTVRTHLEGTQVQALQALINNENLIDVQLLVFRDNAAGVPAAHSRIYFVNANIASVEIYTTRDAAGVATTWVDLSWTYQQIGVEDYGSTISVMDVAVIP